MLSHQTGPLLRRRTTRIDRRILPVSMLACLLAVSGGCHSKQFVFSRGHVEGELRARTAHSAGSVRRAGVAEIPVGVAIEDGITEDEAVALGLWNNALFQDTLSELGISTARLFDAGLLTDPELVVLFPVGPKQLEFTAYTAIDALWLRPIRVRAAELDLCRVGQQMVQNGLNTARDAQLAHADLLLAQQRAELAQDAAKLRGHVAELARKRLAAGDISELEAQTAEVQALQAGIDAQRTVGDVLAAQSRLRARLGLALRPYQLFAVDSPLPLLPARQPANLVAEALAMRPDLRGAELNLDAAAQRAEIAHWQFMRFDGGIDANAEGEQGFEAGPALRMSIPIFNGNRGQRAIALAEQDRASRQVITLRDQIVQEVESAHALAVQAFENLVTTRDQLLPEVQQTVDLAQRNYVGGGTTYFMVLETASQYLDARARELQLSADLRRAIAELERSVGHRLAPRTLQAVPRTPPPEAAPPAQLTPDPLGLSTPRANEGFTYGASQCGDAIQLRRVASRLPAQYDRMSDITQHAAHATDTSADANPADTDIRPVADWRRLFESRSRGR